MQKNAPTEKIRWGVGLGRWVGAPQPNANGKLAVCPQPNPTQRNFFKTTPNPTQPNGILDEIYNPASDGQMFAN